MLRNIITAGALLALWLLMSGLYKPLIIGFGVVSVILVLVIMRRMDLFDSAKLQWALGPLAFIKYMIWLMGEIAKSNWQVTKTILSPNMPIRQNMFEISSKQNTELGQVVFANSITLTPGTVTVETEGHSFLVHALSYSEEDLEALSDMSAHVRATETGALK